MCALARHVQTDWAVMQPPSSGAYGPALRDPPASQQIRPHSQTPPRALTRLRQVRVPVRISRQPGRSESSPRSAALRADPVQIPRHQHPEVHPGFPHGTRSRPPPQRRQTRASCPAPDRTDGLAHETRWPPETTPATIPCTHCGSCLPVIQPIRKDLAESGMS